MVEHLSRDEALRWIKVHSLPHTRRSAAVASGVGRLWDAFAGAYWSDEGHVVREPHDAISIAVSVVYGEIDRRPPADPDACPRCEGAGFIVAFSHVHGGRCFACHQEGE